MFFDDVNKFFVIIKKLTLLDNMILSDELRVMSAG